MPAAFTPVAPAQKPGMMAAPGRNAAFLVEPKAGAAPGVYAVRVETPGGLSNILLFTVGTFPGSDGGGIAAVLAAQPERLHRERRGHSRNPDHGQRHAPGAGARLFRVYGKGGETRVFEVEARRCGSAIDPVLRILDASGRQLARSDDSPATGLDARIDFTFPREGYYYVEVTDARFSTQAQNFYRLKMGAYNYADGIFPLGGRRGEKTEITFFGAHLPAPREVELGPASMPGDMALTTVALPDSPALPFLFAVSDLPELIEPKGDVPVPERDQRTAREGRRYRPLPPPRGTRRAPALRTAGA